MEAEKADAAATTGYRDNQAVYDPLRRITSSGHSHPLVLVKVWKLYYVRCLICNRIALAKAASRAKQRMNLL